MRSSSLVSPGIWLGPPADQFSTRRGLSLALLDGFALPKTPFQQTAIAYSRALLTDQGKRRLDPSPRYSGGAPAPTDPNQAQTPKGKGWKPSHWRVFDLLCHRKPGRWVGTWEGNNPTLNRRPLKITHHSANNSSRRKGQRGIVLAAAPQASGR